jgi:hypothetical protein
MRSRQRPRCSRSGVLNLGTAPLPFSGVRPTWTHTKQTQLGGRLPAQRQLRRDPLLTTYARSPRRLRRGKRNLRHMAKIHSGTRSTLAELSRRDWKTVSFLSLPIEVPALLFPKGDQKSAR